MATKTTDTRAESLLVKIGTVTDRHGETGSNYYLLPKFDTEGDPLFGHESVTGKTLTQWLAHEMPAQSCNHTHDCCGCLFHYFGDAVGFDQVAEQFIIRQSFGRNV